MDINLPSAPGIYAITHVVSGKRYVGSSINILARWTGHLFALSEGTHGNRHLQHAWNKYGEESFSFAVLRHCLPQQLLTHEQRLIDERAEFNIAPVAGSHLGCKQTEETKAKLSRAHKISEKAKVHRANLAARKKGVPLTQEHRAAVSAGLKVSLKMAAAHDRTRGVPLSAQHRANMSAATKGIPHTAEHNEKLRLAALARWEQARASGYVSPMCGRKRRPESITKQKATWADWRARCGVEG